MISDVQKHICLLNDCQNVYP